MYCVYVFLSNNNRSARKKGSDDDRRHHFIIDREKEREKRHGSSVSLSLHHHPIRFNSRSQFSPFFCLVSFPPFFLKDDTNREKRGEKSSVELF